MQITKTRNVPLIIGLGLTGLFLFVALFGSSLAKNDPMRVFNEFVVVDGRAVYPSRSPVAASGLR